jgi:hypothetical protein
MQPPSPQPHSAVLYARFLCNAALQPLLVHADLCAGSRDRSAAAALLCQWGLQCRGMGGGWGEVAQEHLSQVVVVIVVMEMVMVVMALLLLVLLLVIFVHHLLTLAVCNTRQSVGLDALFRAKNAFDCVSGCPDGCYKLYMNTAVDRMVFGALCDAADAAQAKGQVTFREDSTV